MAIRFIVAIAAMASIVTSAPTSQYGNWEAQLRTSDPAEKVRVFVKTMINHFPAILHSMEAVESTVMANLMAKGTDPSQTGKYHTSQGSKVVSDSSTSIINIVSGFLATSFDDKLKGFLYGLVSPELHEYFQDLSLMKTGTPFQWLNAVRKSSVLKGWLMEPLQKSPLWREVTVKAMTTSARQRILYAIVFDMEDAVSLDDFMAVAMDHSSYDNALIEAMATNKGVQKLIDLALNKPSSFGVFVELLTGKVLKSTGGYENDKYVVNVNQEIVKPEEKTFAAAAMFLLNNFSKFMHGFEELDKPQRNFGNLINIMSTMDMTAVQAMGV